MSASSKAQQRLMGLVKAVQAGDFRVKFQNVQKIA